MRHEASCVPRLAPRSDPSSHAGLVQRNSCTYYSARVPLPQPWRRPHRTSMLDLPGLRHGRALLAAALASAAAWIAAACSTPSSGVDGGDLLGVFEQDAGAAAADGGQPRPSAARQDAGARAAGPASAAAPPTKPPEARPPSEGSCVAEQGRPGRELRKTLGRPPCRGAQVLETRDAEGSPRYACVIAPSGVETRAPLPLIVFFHADGDNPTSVDKETGLRKLGATWNLTGDPAHAGFIVLAPQGRAFKTPSQAERERGAKMYTATAPFDVEFTGEGNVDVATVDAFVDQLLEKKLVDRRRIYALGGSYGGHMAATYAMMRADRVAAFATFGSDAPPAELGVLGPPRPRWPSTARATTCSRVSRSSGGCARATRSPRTPRSCASTRPAGTSPTARSGTAAPRRRAPSTTRAGRSRARPTCSASSPGHVLALGADAAAAEAAERPRTQTDTSAR